MSARIPSWSISRWQVFEQCKYRAKLQWLDKVPDLQPKTAADRGTQIHQEAEDHVTGKGPFTQNLRYFKAEFAALRSHYDQGRVTCEEEWAYARDWSVTGWKQGWLRLKCDAVCFLTPKHAVVVDYKTGKRFGNEIKHAEQLQLYALCALLRYPEIEMVTTELWYFDQNELASFVMHRKQMKKYLSIFNSRGVALTTEEDFKPNPNIHSCKYCPYKPGKQGDCAYGVMEDGTRVAPPKPIALPKPKEKLTALDEKLAADLDRFLR